MSCKNNEADERVTIQKQQQAKRHEMQELFKIQEEQNWFENKVLFD